VGQLVDGQWRTDWYDSDTDGRFQRPPTRYRDHVSADLAFTEMATSETTLLPGGMPEEVDAALDAIYEPINDGVYRAGFATTQAAYEDACRELFEALAYWDDALSRQRFLCGDVITEADVAMYTTLVCFDLVYHGHFKPRIEYDTPHDREHAVTGEPAQ
jgi:putative glutathione S-transferase